MKKIPLIGLLIGAGVAIWAFVLRKKNTDESSTEDSGSASGGASST